MIIDTRRTEYRSISILNSIPGTLVYIIFSDLGSAAKHLVWKKHINIVLTKYHIYFSIIIMIV